MDELFARALELEGDALRRFLDGCEADERKEVESMLRFARVENDFLETPVMADPATLASLTEPPTTPRHAIDGNSRFVPGEVVAGRYRIVGLLGRGGMGEVYRADDLKLSQPVALKFLAESLSSNGAALARFHREVSTARQISHRHVCRVYDIGEHAGMHFLSMEYVRGEELSSLLKRIGRLPLDKAVETARQLCAGLAAIHGAGVLHRDLKPANVMIDEHGDVRITDFGVAALSEGVSGREAQVGTPVYMSPEQLSGDELTIRSDIYALGLVLYEAFTGNRPFTATSVPDIVRDRLGDTVPTTPSTFVADLDPLVERVLMRCLEKDPGRRPQTALQVAAALPGGDPVAAALAAGETPSPQMVAAAAKRGSLRPAQALLLVAAIAACIVIAALLSGRTALHRLVPLQRPPDVLEAEAERMAREAGYPAPYDTAFGFREDRRPIDYIAEHGQDPERWDRFRRAPLPAIGFWYRESPLPLVPDDFWIAHAWNPPSDIAGMVNVRLDTMGRLLYFQAVPPQLEPSGGAPPRADWSRFFARSGLAMSAFRPAAPRWTPPRHADERLSWTGVHPAWPSIPLRVEASSYRGMPTWFEVVYPWSKPEREASSMELTDEAFEVSLVTFYFGALAVAVLLAWKNVRAGRGDRRGAFRLMLFMFLMRIVYWFFVAHHVSSVLEVLMVVAAISAALYWSAITGLVYLALEPFLRRRWPHLLISWSRLLAGDVRDPLVGRDVLIGLALGIGGMLTSYLSIYLPPLLGYPMQRPVVSSDLIYSFGLGGARGFVPLLINQLSASILFPMMITAVVLFAALIIRRRAVAFAVAWLLFYLVLNLRFTETTAVGYVLGLIMPTLIVGALVRYGLLALISFFFAVHLWAFYPITTEVTKWYATTYVLQLAVLGVLVLYAFRISLAGQKLVTRSIFED